MIRNLQHFALTVPDVEAGQRFYETFGLDSEARGNRLALNCAGRAQDQVLLSEGPKRRLHHIGFGTTAAGLASAKMRLEAGGSAAGGRGYARRPLVSRPRRQSGQSADRGSAPQATPGGRMNSPGDFRRLGAAARGRTGAAIKSCSTCAFETHGCSARHGLLQGYPGDAGLGHRRRPYPGLPAHRRRQRPSRAGLRPCRPPRLPPCELRGRQPRRDRAGCRARGRGRLPQRLGHGPPCRVQFLPLSARS